MKEKTSLGKSKKQTHKERSIYGKARCWKCHTTLMPTCALSTYTTFMNSECVLQSMDLELLWAKQYSWQVIICASMRYIAITGIMNGWTTNHLKIILGKNMNPSWQWDQESSRMKTYIKYIASFGENSIHISGRIFMKWSITNASASTEEIS